MPEPNCPGLRTELRRRERPSPRGRSRDLRERTTRRKCPAATRRDDERNSPPPPGHAPPRDQPRIVVSSRERDANGLPLFSTLMDNVIASRAAVDNINV